MELDNVPDELEARMQEMEIWKRKDYEELRKTMRGKKEKRQMQKEARKC